MLTTAAMAERGKRLCNPVSTPLHVRSRRASMSPVGGRRPLKIASLPERRPLARTHPSAALSLPRHICANFVSLARTAEYQNKEARRTVAAPARRPAGVGPNARRTPVLV
ncbi:jg12792 [Pararge aegeria aegeria]|uniref:Jg12792 protein n=1 Tax=Pararge aegeria aegeria TaxID=348720 RepID=A0A8S4RLE1_9NEOP|nr:jg12792 [Pararge aegeria aegeria]